MDFKRRKQPLCFYNPRKSVLAVLQGVSEDEIVHCFTYDELEQTLNGKVQVYYISILYYLWTLVGIKCIFYNLIKFSIGV